MKPIYLATILLFLLTPLHAQNTAPKVVDKAFISWAAASYGSALADFGIRCAGCRERNPILGQNRARMYGIGLGLATSGTAVSYILKKHGFKKWWLPQAVSISSHTFGITYTLSKR